MSEERDLLAPRTENERRALELFDKTHYLAYAANLSEEDLQRALARLAEMARAATGQWERESIQSMRRVLSNVIEEADLERRFAPADPELIAQAEGVFGWAGRDGADREEFRGRLSEGIARLKDLAKKAKQRDEYSISEMVGTLVKMRFAQDQLDRLGE